MSRTEITEANGVQVVEPVVRLEISLELGTPESGNDARARIRVGSSVLPIDLGPLALKATTTPPPPPPNGEPEHEIDPDPL